MLKECNAGRCYWKGCGSHSTSSCGNVFVGCIHLLSLSLFSELSETGRMLSSALSDGYLTLHDECHVHSDLGPLHQHLSMSLDSRHFAPSSDDTLFPPLTHNDRHPSAPQLVSMLTDNKADIMLHDDQVL
jgi:hypothetical protein